MYRAVTEEASLAEVPVGVTDFLGNGGQIVHGPWEPAKCSAHLLRWLEEGLIELFDEREGHPTNRPDLPGHPSTRHGPTGALPVDRARELLKAWQRWSEADALWQSTRLSLTDKGLRELTEPERPPQ